MLLTSCSTSIQKQINVTKNLRSTAYLGFNLSYRQNILGQSGTGKKYLEALSYECSKDSIGQAGLNKMLEKGAKIITSTKWEQAASYSTTLEYLNGEEYKKRNNGTCIGISYIFEGKKSLLEEFSPSK